MRLGGPVWHASVARIGQRGSTGRLLPVALAALHGLGDSALGEWHESSEIAYHIRRRLSVLEQKEVGPVIDIRGTDEARRRLAKVRQWVPVGWTE